MSFPVTHNPGWNDPPVFSYDAVAGTAQSKTPKRGLLLNKRVAFPLSSQPPSNKPPTTNNVLPAIPMTSAGPPVQPGLPLLVHSTREGKTSEENVQQSLQKEEALQKVMEGFEQILKDSAHDFEVCLSQYNILSILGLSLNYTCMQKNSCEIQIQ